MKKGAMALMAWGSSWFSRGPYRSGRDEGGVRRQDQGSGGMVEAKGSTLHCGDQQEGREIRMEGFLRLPRGLRREMLAHR